MNLYGCMAGCVAALALAGSALGAELTPERLFGAPSVIGETAHGVELSPDGRFVSYLRPAANDPGATAVWIMATKGGAGRVLLDTRRLGEASKTLSEEQMKFVERRHSMAGETFDYAWSQDGAKLLLAYNGDLYIAAVANGSVRQLTKGEEAGDPHLAPDGRTVSFARAHRLVLHNVESGAEQVIGDDASQTISYGQAEFVAQEEMQRFAGSWWSPDGRRIAYARVDESNVTQVARLKIDAKAISIVLDRFPLAGTANADVKLFVRSLSGGPPIPVDLGSNPDIYVYDVTWSANGDTLYVQRQSHDQKRLDLLAIDPATGRGRLLLSETSTTWVELERDFRPLRDGRFLWGSARTGWQHLYLYDRNGELIRPVTSGNWRVANLGAGAAPDLSPILGVDEDHSLVYFLASRETPIERQIYRISYAAPQAPLQVTSGHGWWTPAMMAGSPTTFVGTYSNQDTPPRTGLFDLGGRLVSWLAENRLDPTHPYFAFLDHRPSYEFGTIKAADGEDLHYFIAKPAGFDPTRRYPAIVRVYGGPNVEYVTREWRPLTDQLYTQAGYVVFALDSRGTSNRDLAFEHAISGALGGLSTVDQIAGVHFLAGQPYIDPDRIGIAGWSFGGYETVRTMSTPGSGLRAGAGGGVPSDFSLYDTHYTERYLGTPQARPSAYNEAALLPHIKDFSGELLVLQGLSDDNVQLGNFTRLVTELQAQGKTFDTEVFPGQSHVIRGPAAQTRLMGAQLRFFSHALAQPRGSPPLAKTGDKPD
jgi:dipeptidyl-peptidase-4